MVGPNGSKWFDQNGMLRPFPPSSADKNGGGGGPGAYSAVIFAKEYKNVEQVLTYWFLYSDRGNPVRSKNLQDWPPIPVNFQLQDWVPGVWPDSLTSSQLQDVPDTGTNILFT